MKNIPQKILIIQTAFIGDAILASSMVETWVHSYPSSQIDVLVRKGNESLFESNPHVNKVLIWDKKKHKYRNLFALLMKIRKAKYDAVFNVQRFFATGFLSAFSGAAFISGFKNNPLSAFFDLKVEFDTEIGKHETERNAALMAPFIQTAASKPKLYPTPADHDLCQEYKKGPYICIAPTSVWFTKQWPAENWIQLINSFDKETVVYLLGAPSDFEACEAIRKACQHENTVNLAGKLSFLQSASLMRDASMNYVNDSAPMHIASSMNAPTVAIYCSTLPSFGFGPLSDDAKIVEYLGELPCRPCGLHGKSKCPEGHFNCSNTLTQLIN
jgi:heptosyltransferase-2